MRPRLTSSMHLETHYHTKADFNSIGVSPAIRHLLIFGRAILWSKMRSKILIRKTHWCKR